MSAYDATDVFTPTGVPTLTYVYRQDQDLESHLRAAVRTPGMIVSLSGPSKSGKTVLIRKVIPEEDLISVSGGSLTSPEQLWDRVLSWMEAPSETTTRTATTVGGEAGGRGTVSAGVSFLAKGEIEGSGKLTGSRLSEKSEKRGRSGIDQVVSEIANSSFIVFIDDFHYMAPDVQTAVSRQIKEVAEKGVKVCTASVPHRSDDVVRSNPELRGRVQAIDFYYWSDDDIRQIATQGFAALGIIVPAEFIDQLVKEAFGSPQLMQGMCLQTCFQFDVEQTKYPPIAYSIDESRMRKILEQTSSTTDFSTLLETLHTGPKSRGMDRNQYQFYDGSAGDVYRCVLLALKTNPPALTFRYDEIIARTKVICSGNSPSGSSVSEALLQMDKLSAAVQPGSKIIEWDDDVLDISDPYFLFYLRCSPRIGKIRSPGAS
ncbi:hypothetical protein LRS73_27030 [Methylobacterium currus]|uniref:hypothetical protein n=1 Tax=Methylobacterium currus TaxID=2051553 RepID=UPI001E323C82|nr:hypothetical protein [Methylobacterium currus]UHC16089.1 hypothetical protein LRS73_27030 [Methylobacterium currus]